MGTTSRLLRGSVLAAAVIVTVGCGGTSTPSRAPASSSVAPSTPTGSATAVVWPAPPNPMDLAVQAGLKPGPREFGVNHVHAHLDVFVEGKSVTVPAGIGIQVTDPNVQTFNQPDGSTEYGGIELCNDPCISPLHTHDVSGILHTESATAQANTLGEFFTEWGLALDASCVATYCSPATKIAIYVDGVLTPGDPRTIALTNQREIAIVIGTPPDRIPSTADFSKA